MTRSECRVLTSPCDLITLTANQTRPHRGFAGPVSRSIVGWLYIHPGGSSPVGLSPTNGKLGLACAEPDGQSCRCEPSIR
jgi:hypothetical protein